MSISFWRGFLFVFLFACLFLPVYVFHNLWTDSVGVFLIYVILTILCEVFSLLWIKFLWSSQKSVHLSESLLTPKCFLFVCFSSHFIFRGLCGFLSKYERAFFTLHLPLKGRLIGKTHGEAEIKITVWEKSFTQQIQITREHIFICNVPSSMQGRREQEHILSPKGKRHSFFSTTPQQMW